MATTDWWMTPQDIHLLTPPQALSTAGELVAQRFGTASAYAGNLWELAQTLLAQLSAVDFTVDWTGIDLGVVSSSGLDGINAAEPSPLSVADITMATVEFPYSPPDPVINTMPVRVSPSENLTDPGFSIPGPPDVSWPTFSSQVPSIADSIIPEAPMITLPAVPQLSDIVIPSPPEYSIPEFDWELPTDNITAPEPQFVWNEAEYDSDIRRKVAEKLFNELVSGGTGFPEATEQAIYSRATSRMRDEEQVALDQMLDFFSGRGFDLPPGALAGQMLELNNKILKTREDLNNDILVQQSKLAQENTQFIIKASLENEKMLMDYTNQFQGRAFEAAKFVVLSALQVYSAKIEMYKAKLSIYATQAEIYKARVMGETAKAEFYKAQMQGLVAAAEVQKTMIEAYKAQVGAVGMSIELYKAEMEGAQIRASIDEVRIKAFAALVQAYSAQVAAVSERYKGYQAQISGEVAKAEMYKAQVEAYTARVGAYRTEVEADTMVLKQELAINENQVEIFKARIQQYLAQVQASIGQVDAQAKIEGVKVDAFKAEMNGYAAELDVLAKVYLGKIEEAKARAEIEIKEADLTIRESLGRQELIQGNTKAAAQIASQMAAAAISGVNASASIQNGESRSDSTSLNQSFSMMQQAVVSQLSTINHSTIHQYNYSG
jgi:hypothetical protein